MLQTILRTESLFWATAVGGSLFFVLRVLTMIVGGFGAEGGAGAGADAEFEPTTIDADTGVPVDASDVPDVDADTAHDPSLEESGPAFKLLSINSITGFIMMFGWAGLTTYVQFDRSMWVSLVVASLVGFITMVVTSLLFSLALRLTSSGAKFQPSQAVGTIGEVYMRIPEDGVGQVKVVVNDTSRIVDAVSEDKVAIESFQRVKVVGVSGSVTLSVRKL